MFSCAIARRLDRAENSRLSLELDLYKRMNYLNVPLEIWAGIFEYLSPASLAILSATCRSLNRTTNADFIWSRICRDRHLEIDFNSLNSEKSYKERFKSFHLSRKRLLTLDPRESVIKDSHSLGVSFLQESQKGFVSAGWDGQVLFHEQIENPQTYRVSKSLQQGDCRLSASDCDRHDRMHFAETR